jgi:hypothetical protein
VTVTEPALPPVLANATDTRLVIVKVPVVEPAGTDATRGTAAPGSDRLRAMVAPPAGAGPVRVIVQVLEPFSGTAAGLHSTEEITIAAERAIFTV